MTLVKNKICKVCGVEFTPIRNNHMIRVCSIECSLVNQNRVKREYYDRNKQDVIARASARQKENPNEYKETRLAYVKKHKKQCIAYNKKWKRDNKEKVNAVNKKPERIAYMKEYRNPEFRRVKERTSGRKYKERNPEACKNGHLKRNYNITIDTFDEMRRNQDNKCAICFKKETGIDSKKGKLKDLSVDHCHTTGKVRGLLCFRCNSTLGRWCDSVELLQNAIDYLRRNSNENS